MPKPTRPTIKAPGGGSILDEVDAASTHRPPGQPPFARRPQPAPPTPEPEHATAAEPVDPEPEEVPPAPTRRAAPARPARTRAPRAAARPATPPGIPQPPPGYVESTKPLQVYLPGGDHWLLKYRAMLKGTDMTSIVAALVSAYNADPDAWNTLMERAEEERVPIGELLAPALAQAVEDEG